MSPLITLIRHIQTLQLCPLQWVATVLVVLEDSPSLALQATKWVSKASVSHVQFSEANRKWLMEALERLWKVMGF